MTWLSVAPYVVGISTEDVVAIREGQDDSTDRERLDLARHCGVAPLEGARRRTLVLAGDPGVDLVAQDEVRVEPVAVSDIHPLPSYLEGLGPSLAFAGFVARGRGYGVLLDVSALRARAIGRGGT